MAIKATFLAGEDTITTKAKLHQWDYGQTLEIEAMDLSPWGAFCVSRYE